MEPAAHPTANELQALTDAFRRDPASNFVRLGNCLLALGRPADAVETGTHGLRQAPNNLEGRIMMGVAYSQLHRWKEAQVELLKVVKADRGNGRGFRLLGEVLLRRNDFERALPVLQHAQNLNPSDSEVLALVRRARDGIPLDPPPAVPIAQRPAAASPPPVAHVPSAPMQSRSFSSDDDVATLVADDVGVSYPPKSPAAPPPALGRMELRQREQSSQAPAAPSHRVSAAISQDRRNQPAAEFAPVQHYQKPAIESPLAPIAAQPRHTRPSAPPPPAPGAPDGAPVRPRVIPAQKTKDAAQKGLRASAAVGEQYLNNLLQGGLLDVPNVRVSEANYDASPGKRWGRSSARMFVFLFVVMISAAAGSGVWYWYADKQMRADVDRHLDNARKLIDSGDQSDLKAAVEKVDLAIARDSSSSYTLAVAAEVRGLSGYLYGDYPSIDVERAVRVVSEDISTLSDKGFRELVIARAAQNLRELYSEPDGAEDRLSETQAELKSWLERSPDDHLARWLQGRAYLAAGDRNAAFVAFTKAHANGSGAVLGTIDLGNFHLNNGEYEKAIALFDDALSRSPKHPLAFVGRSMARSDRSMDSDAAIADLNVGLEGIGGLTLLAWKELAMAGVQLSLQDYEAFNTALNKTVGPQDPNFLARVALGRVLQGRVEDAIELRGQIRWFASNPKGSPLVTVLDAELLLAHGLPQDALDAIADLSGVRAISVRGRALFDLGQPAKALLAFEEAVKAAPDDIDLMVWMEASRMMSTKGDTRRKADEALDSLGRRAQSKTARYVHGKALAFIGKKSLAQDKLEQSVTDISAASPNALAYRSFLELARLAFSSGKNSEAVAFLEKAVLSNPSFLPIKDLYGQVLVDIDPAKAMRNLADVQEAKVASIGADLAYARALIKTGGSKEDASAIVRKAKERGASTRALQKVISEVNPALFEELEIASIEEPSE